MRKETGRGQRKKRTGSLRNIWNGITWLFVGCIAFLAVALAGVRLFGFTPYAVLSASMTPEYGVGDLVYVKETDPEKIGTGDVITFTADKNLTVVTHRVAEVDRENRCFYTKGDANDSRDAAPVLYENVVGVVRFSLPKLGYLSAYLTGASGRYAGIAVFFALVLLFLLPELIKPDSEKKAAERKKRCDERADTARTGEQV